MRGRCVDTNVGGPDRGSGTLFGRVRRLPAVVPLWDVTMDVSLHHLLFRFRYVAITAASPTMNSVSSRCGSWPSLPCRAPSSLAYFHAYFTD